MGDIQRGHDGDTLNGHGFAGFSYFSHFRVDVIDRSQFPGAPGARPGGMSATDFFVATRLLAADPKVRLIDLTEWDPPLDPSDLSALVAGRWMAECLAGYEAR